MPAPSPRRNIKANNSKNNNSNNYSNSNSNSNNNTKNNNKKDNPVVASLPVPANDANSATQPQHPFSSIAVSPDKEYAVMARKDTLLIVNVGPAGILPFRTVPVAQHFQTNVASTGTNADSRAASADPMGRIYGDVRDTFSPAFGILGQRTGATQASSNGANVILTDVAWSTGTGTGSPQQPAPRQTYPAEKKNKNIKNKNNKNKNNKNKNDTSLIAAAGSNGAIVVWSAETLLQTAESGRFPAPDALLNKHVRAVNRLAWHPRRPGLLLSASQDGTVLLWERLRKVANTAATGNNGRDSIKSATTTKQGWFGKMSAQVKDPNKERSYSWHCRATFEPKSEAVRDIRWSPFYDDVFALVTSSGNLIAYNIYVPSRALLKITAHSGESTTLDWHPIMPDIIATGGAGDRSVKVWDLESYLNMKKDDSNMSTNMNTAASRTESVATEGSTESDPSSHSYTTGSMSMNVRTVSSQSTLNSSRQHSKGAPKSMLHVLSISASVTRVKWRPPAGDMSVLDDEDRHASMLAVATAPIKGASAGGSGLLALWSYHRPFMPLSVVEGHKDGAVTDFEWLDTPQPAQLAKSNPAGRTSPSKQSGSTDSRRGRRGQATQGKESSAKPSTNQFRTLSARSGGGSGSYEPDAFSFDNSEAEDADQPVGIWQHAISVGRDGRCLLQSFARGERPIRRVPPSCFAMANLSPFQKGYGSLQLFSVCQAVPSGPQSNFLLTGLRKDSVTAQALGVFREEPSEAGPEGLDPVFPSSLVSSRRLPSNVPELVFNVLDQGDLDDESTPADAQHKGITIAPEVVHLSRFADNYVLHPNEKYTSRVALCRHNADVAGKLRCGPLAQMWTTVATMVESAGLDGLPQSGSQPSNVMQFVILPTIKSLLEERADAGDVQTCVTLCEILGVVAADQTVQIPGLELILVREWYLSYIDILRDMCLFSHATSLIRACKDPFIAALNQQSTTIHESCPHCGKPLLQADGASNDPENTARRACKSCRRRVGLCFLCHQPVKGMYVWCPGCGHGGHLDHALQWFGGMSGKPVREVCPSGCGHKCNMLQPLSAFPRTESFCQLVQSSEQMDVLPPGGL